MTFIKARPIHPVLETNSNLVHWRGIVASLSDREQEIATAVAEATITRARDQKALGLIGVALALAELYAVDEKRQEQDVEAQIKRFRGES